MPSQTQYNFALISNAVKQRPSDLTFAVGEELSRVALEFDDCFDQKGVVAQHALGVALQMRVLHVEGCIVYLASAYDTT